MKNRAEVVRQLEEETCQARERFEREARHLPDIWAAYERWRAYGDESMGRWLRDYPELSRLWSAYVPLAKCGWSRSCGDLYLAILR
jgi:hypothetical protein